MTVIEAADVPDFTARAKRRATPAAASEPEGDGGGDELPAGPASWSEVLEAVKGGAGKARDRQGAAKLPGAPGRKRGRPKKKPEG